MIGDFVVNEERKEPFDASETDMTAFGVVLINILAKATKATLFSLFFVSHKRTLEIFILDSVMMILILLIVIHFTFKSIFEVSVMTQELVEPSCHQLFCALKSFHV